MQNGQNGQATNDAIHIEGDIRSITDAIRATGLAAPKPTEQEVMRDYGEAGGRNADQLVEVFLQRTEQTISGHFSAVERLEARAAEARRNTEYFAEKLRNYSVAFEERIRSYDEFCQLTTDAIAAHVKLFDEHLAREFYPRAPDGPDSKPSGKH